MTYLLFTKGTPQGTGIPVVVQQVLQEYLLKKVESLVAEFKRLHLALINLLSTDGDLRKE